MDRRVEKTRSAIVQGFQRLLLQKPYPKITVQNIIDEANIGRGTFYAHYNSKDDLLDAFCITIFDHVFSKDLTKEKTHDFSSHKKEPFSMMTHILYHIRDNKHLLPGIVQGEGATIFWGYFSTYFKDFVQEYVLADNQLPTNDVPIDFILQQITGSFMEMVKWWTFHRMETSPEELLNYYQKCHPHLFHEKKGFFI